MSQLAACLFVILFTIQDSAMMAAEPADKGLPDPSGVTDVVILDEPRLNESSGLAVSYRDPKRFWSHNDSGGETCVYAFDPNGRKTGEVKLNSVRMNDWEDMASFVQDGVPRLLIADSGDNDLRRSRIQIHIFDEPDPSTETLLGRDQVQSISVTYEDGPHDCEAVAVDFARNVIVLVTKGRLPYCGVYSFPLPSRIERVGEVIARRINTLPIPMITAMDVDPVSGDLWMASYFHTFCFRCAQPGTSLQSQLAGLPEVYELPRWRQIEAIAVDATHHVWVTSEGSRPPLGRLSPEALAAQREHD